MRHDRLTSITQYSCTAAAAPPHLTSLTGCSSHGATLSLVPQLIVPSPCRSVSVFE